MFVSGLGSICLQDISILSNRFNDEENLNNYHFIIKIPYAGKQLKWEVIFDPEDFYFAPDFEFNDDQFLNSPDYEMIASNVPSLVNWNLKDPKALSQVLNEFISLYKKLQVNFIKSLFSLVQTRNFRSKNWYKTTYIRGTTRSIRC